MNRNLCMLSASRGKPFLVVARFQDGVLLVARAEEIRPKATSQEGGARPTVSVDDLVNKELSEYHAKGYAVAVDEDIPRYSIPYQHTPLLTGDQPILVDAFRSYLDLAENKKIVFRKGVTEIRSDKVAESEIADGGKQVYRVDSSEFTPARAAMLLVAYHAQNADITDIQFLRALFPRNRKPIRPKRLGG